MVYDCFTFFNELDLLEIRLNTLKDVVDCFVIAEATRTHRGKPKELFFEKNRERYASFLDRIRYIVVDNLLSEEEVEKDAYNLPWANENRQRNALQKGVDGANDDDVVMLSDVDEIPRPEAVQYAVAKLSKKCPSLRMELDFFNFYLNFHNYSYPTWKLGTQALRYGYIRNGCEIAKVKPDRYTQLSENAGPTFNKIRFLRSRGRIKKAGWHFSFLGGVKAIQNKLAAFSHSEFSSVPVEVLEQRLKNGDDLFGRVGKSFGVAIDSSLPDYVVENRTRFSNLIFPVDEAYFIKTRRDRMYASLRGRMYRMLVAMVPEFLAPVAVRIRDVIMRRLGRI